MEEKTNVKRCFKERFSELRAKSGLSQNKLGKALSLSPATIGYYENGSRLPDIETAARIARYFDVSADYLLGLSDAKSVEQDMKTACETTGLTETAVLNIQVIGLEIDCVENKKKGQAEKAIFLDFLESSSFRSVIGSSIRAVMLNIKKEIQSDKSDLLQESFVESVEQTAQKSGGFSKAFSTQTKNDENGIFARFLESKNLEKRLESKIFECYSKIESIIDSYAKRVAVSFVEEIRKDYSDKQKQLINSSMATDNGFNNTIDKIDSALYGKKSDSEQEANNDAQHHTTEE